MSPDLPVGNPSKFEIIDSSNWNLHWLLSRLSGGSGLDGDWAHFWPEQQDVTSEDLRRIVFQICIPGGEWTDCAPADGDFFPSQGNAQAVAGAYISLLFSNPVGTQKRAKVPEDLMSKPN